jgi:PKD repeat protein
MAEGEPTPKKGWLKAILGTIGGLLSGAVAMYATAALNQVVKPSKPVANFKYDCTGTTVRFQNLSGAGQGWWDFGDGSALEPVAGRKVVTHTYARPGDYTVKLSLQNILGEEADRAVAVHIDAAGNSADGPPRVASLEADPVSPGGYAPATFRVAAKVQNAQVCLLDFGDERPPEVLPGSTAERLVTFKEPGGHVVKLIAINGSRLDAKTEIVNVEECPCGSVSAVVNISDSAVRLVSRQRGVELHGDDPQSASEGFVITDVSVPAGGQTVSLNGRTVLDLDPAALGLKHARNVKVQILNGGTAVQLTGDPGQDWKGRPQVLKATLILTEQSRVPVNQERETSTTLALPTGRQPSTATAALPSVTDDWVDVKRQARLKLLDGEKVLWQGALPSSATFAVGNRSCVLGVTAANGGLHFELRDAPAGSRPAAN